MKHIYHFCERAFTFQCSYNVSRKVNDQVFGQVLNKQKAVLSQGEPRDVAVNFDTYRILQ